jgi:hypothetical protein
MLYPKPRTFTQNLNPQRYIVDKSEEGRAFANVDCSGKLRDIGATFHYKYFPFYLIMSFLQIERERSKASFSFYKFN